MENKIAVVILNYNGRSFLEKFLPFVLEFSPQADVIVADNASTDDSIELLTTKFPSAELIVLTENHGFAKGYNEALRDLEHDYFILLNSDVEVTPNWLQPLIDQLDKHQNVAAVQPKILSYHNKSKFEYAGAAGGFVDWLGYPFCRGRIFETTEFDQKQYNNVESIFWATGACFAIRAEVYKKMNGFDDFFFAHMEEIDLCWRIKNEGFEIHFTPESTVYHVGGGTLHKSNPIKTFLNYRNGLLMLYKNLPQNQLFQVIFFRLILDGFSSILFIKKLEFQNIWAVIQAHFAFYRAIFTKKVTRNPNSKPQNLYPKSIVWQYFILKKKHFSQLSKW